MTSTPQAPGLDAEMEVLNAGAIPRLRHAIDCIARGRSVRLQPDDLCSVLHRAERAEAEAQICSQAHAREVGRRMEVEAERDAALTDAARLRQALVGMLEHSCVSDAAPEDKFAVDHAFERAARTALAAPGGEPS